MPGCFGRDQLRFKGVESRFEFVARGGTDHSVFKADQLVQGLEAWVHGVFWKILFRVTTNSIGNGCNRVSVFSEYKSLPDAQTVDQLPQRAIDQKTKDGRAVAFKRQMSFLN